MESNNWFVYRLWFQMVGNCDGYYAPIFSCPDFIIYQEYISLVLIFTGINYWY